MTEYENLREEPLKSKIREDYFSSFKYTQLGNIDFVIAIRDVDNGQRSLWDESERLKSILWAEAKQGDRRDIYESFVQLILTIGKEKTYEKQLPPKYIGAFDAAKFAFIEYHDIQEIFFRNDFNWNAAPSNHDTKEFKTLYGLCKKILEENSILFYYEQQSKELKEFIRLNFKSEKEVSEKISVTKNNFTFVFIKWREKVMPQIAVDWEKSKKAGIISADFFLADLLSSGDESLKENLYVVLKKTKYELAKKIDELGFESVSTVGFKDRQKAYKEFWSIYERPPKEEYWDYIINRRDLLVPQDIRERRGSFFTPQIWVEKSQAYIAAVLGETWQDEYYIWDCCAGTGNLLNGLANYDNVWASTLDKQDVDVMKDRIAGGWRMAEDHVFQFDFLNDDFSSCPEELREILNDEQKRKRLVIYINPPYAEAGNKKTIVDKSGNKISVSNTSAVWEKNKDEFGLGIRELYVQFLIRIYDELRGCVIAQFSKLKIFEGSAFVKFRNYFKAELKRCFLVPAKTFDNVTGEFPIGFFIWNTQPSFEQKDSVVERVETTVSSQKVISTGSMTAEISADVFDDNGNFLQQKILSTEKKEAITKWISQFDVKSKVDVIGYTGNTGPDFQHNSFLYISSKQIILPSGSVNNETKYSITKNNLIPICIYIAARLSVPATWLNDRDQFLFPNDDWQSDKEFQADCIAFTLFHGQNRITSEQGDNQWIPFTREQVGCKKSFKSHFMSDFLAGKIQVQQNSSLFEGGERQGGRAVSFSKEAQDVYDAGLALWKYYHSKSGAKANASFYDIRKYFQGQKNGKMNAASDDSEYTALIGDLRSKQKTLAKKIAPKVYEYGFLR